MFDPEHVKYIEIIEENKRKEEEIEQTKINNERASPEIIKTIRNTGASINPIGRGVWLARIRPFEIAHRGHQENDDGLRKQKPARKNVQAVGGTASGYKSMDEIQKACAFIVSKRENARKANSSVNGTPKNKTRFKGV